jgi:hypothetical protein
VEAVREVVARAVEEREELQGKEGELSGSAGSLSSGEGR